MEGTSGKAVTEGRGQGDQGSLTVRSGAVKPRGEILLEERNLKYTCEAGVVVYSRHSRP